MQNSTSIIQLNLVKFAHEVLKEIHCLWLFPCFCGTNKKKWLVQFLWDEGMNYEIYVSLRFRTDIFEFLKLCEEN